jgi:hypothetical protein
MRNRECPEGTIWPPLDATPFARALGRDPPDRENRFMDPRIGAALIGVGGAAVGVIGIVISVYLTARRAQDHKRQELVASALSDYMTGVAKSTTARGLEAHASSVSDVGRKSDVLKEAVDVRLEAFEIAVQAKVRLLAFADSDLLERLAQWDRSPVAADPGQQRALLGVIDSVRHQLVGRNAASLREPARLGLMFGWPGEPE